MTSHYLSQIYNRRILLESVFDEDFREQLIAASEDEWYVNYQLQKLKRIYSNDASLYDETSLMPQVDFALRHAKHMYGNLQRLVKDHITSEESRKYPWLLSSDVEKYINVCKRIGETDAPVALDYYENLYNEAMQKADSFVEALKQDLSLIHI